MYLLINGGLGNQLFQLAYANYISETQSKKVFLVPQNVSGNNRDFLLKIFLEQFPNLTIERIPKRLSIPISIIKHLPTSVSKLKAFKTLDPIFSYPSAYAFEPVSGSAVQFGYFQSKNLLTGANSNLASIFSDSLERYYPDSAFRDKFILHIRGGDLHQYRESMGILDVDYYSRALERMDVDPSQCIALTDDLNHAKSIVDQIGITSIIGPQDMDAFESFALMAFSKKLVCANSTFSWWAGVISKNRGGVVYHPKPWFLNWEEDPGDSFDYPGFEEIPSSFCH